MPRSVPNYLTTDAQGKVNADFSGRIHGAGVDLDVSNGTLPSTGLDVRWVRVADGKVYGSISTERNASPSDNICIRATQLSDASIGDVSVIADLQGDYLNTGILHRRRLITGSSGVCVLNDGTGDSDNVGIRGGLSGHRMQFLWDGNIRCYVDNVYVGAISLV